MLGILFSWEVEEVFWLGFFLAIGFAQEWELEEVEQELGP